MYDDQYKQAGTLNSWSLIVTPAIPAPYLRAEGVGRDAAAVVLTLAQTQPLLAESRARCRRRSRRGDLLSGIDLHIGDLGGTTRVWLPATPSGWTTTPPAGAGLWMLRRKVTQNTCCPATRVSSTAWIFSPW